MVSSLAAVLTWLIRGLALRKALVDRPNERSSHTVPVPRLGGAAFVPVVLLGFVLFRESGRGAGIEVAVIGGSLALYVVSLIDDVRSLPTGIRFAVQFLAALGMLFMLWRAWPSAFASVRIHHFSVLDALPAVLLPPSSGFWLLSIWIVGVINIYNFMDGIDGIAGLQAVVAGLAWAIFGSIHYSSFSAVLGGCAAAGALGFLFFNWSPAKIFMGDAGSTVLGYIFATLPLVFVVEARSSVRPELALTTGAFILWPFLLDGVFTILRRLKNGENILQAHRSHLYQRLVIAGKSHQHVTLVYGGLAISGALLGGWILSGASGAVEGAMILVGVAFWGLWSWTVRVESEKTKSCRTPSP